MMTKNDSIPSSQQLPVRTYTDDEALEYLLSVGRTSLTGVALAREWGWNDMRVSRRLRQWEEAGLITRRNGEIITAITPAHQRVNRTANASATSHNKDRWYDNLSLRFVAFGLFVTGATINGYYTYSQGASSIVVLGFTVSAAWLLMAVGILGDIAAYSLPDRAAVRWRQGHRGTSVLAWLLCIPLVMFAFLNNTGFTSVNLSDTAKARAERTTPAVDLAQRKADTLTKSREDECRKRGPLCRDLEDKEQTALKELKAERDKAAAEANPQSAKTAKLIAWATFGYLQPTVDDIANLFLLLFAALPLSGGLIRMIARRR